MFGNKKLPFPPLIETILLLLNYGSLFWEFVENKLQIYPLYNFGIFFSFFLFFFIFLLYHSSIPPPAALPFFLWCSSSTRAFSFSKTRGRESSFVVGKTGKSFHFSPNDISISSIPFMVIYHLLINLCILLLVIVNVIIWCRYY